MLQSDDVNLTKLPVYVQSLISSLSGVVEALNTNKGQLLEYFSKIDSFLDIIKERAPLARRLRGVTDLDLFDKDKFIKEVIQPFIYDLMGEIQDAMHIHPVLQAFGVLDPRNLPEEIEELHEYGHSDIDR